MTDETPVDAWQFINGEISKLRSSGSTRWRVTVAVDGCVVNVWEADDGSSWTTHTAFRLVDN